jgi:hypothetical protein
MFLARIAADTGLVAKAWCSMSVKPELFLLMINGFALLIGLIIIIFSVLILR